MAVLSVIPDFVVFISGGALAALLVKLLPARRIWAVLPLAVAAVAAFNWLNRSLRFDGLANELLVGLAAIVALALALTCWCDMDKRGVRSRHPNRWMILPGILTLIMTASVLMPYGMRVLHAMRLRWECDGAIVEKYISNDHAAPALVVRNDDGSLSRFERVHRGLWERAALNDRLCKRKGHRHGELNGQRVEVVDTD